MRVFVRYFAVGGVSAAVDFCIFGLLVYGLGTPWFWAALVSFLLATTVNYILSVRHVFESGVRFKKHHEISLVFVVSSIGLAVNQFVLYVGIEQLALYPLLAKVMATGMVFFWNFLARSKFIFKP